MTDLDYVTAMLKSNIFNTTQVAAVTKISRSTLLKIINGKPVKEYIIVALAVFFKNVGSI